MTLAKGLGGGVPLAALVAHQDVCCFEYGDQGGTFCGNPIMAAVGCAVMEAVTAPGFLAHVTQAGEHLTECLRAVTPAPLRRGARQGGCCWRSTSGVDISVAVADRALARGLLLNAPRPDLLRFMPALTVTDDEINRTIDILDSVLAEIAAG